MPPCSLGIVPLHCGCPIAARRTPERMKIFNGCVLKLSVSAGPGGVARQDAHQIVIMHIKLILILN